MFSASRHSSLGRSLHCVILRFRGVQHGVAAVLILCINEKGSVSASFPISNFRLFGVLADVFSILFWGTALTQPETAGKPTGIADAKVKADLADG